MPGFIADPDPVSSPGPPCGCIKRYGSSHFDIKDAIAVYNEEFETRVFLLGGIQLSFGDASTGQEILKDFYAKEIANDREIKIATVNIPFALVAVGDFTSLVNGEIIKHEYGWENLQKGWFEDSTIWYYEDKKAS